MTSWRLRIRFDYPIAKGFLRFMGNMPSIGITEIRAGGDGIVLLQAIDGFAISPPVIRKLRSLKLYTY